MVDPRLTRVTGSGAPLATLQIDVIADLICPWSYLGKRRLDDALLAVRGPSEVSWYPWQLNPEMPEEGMALNEYLVTKFGDPVKLQPALDELTLLGKAEGINFHFDRIERVPNSLNAHRLMRLAEDEGADTSKLAEDLFRSFFEQGLDVADRDVLIRVGEHSGLEAAAVNKTLDDDLSRRIVLSQEAQVRQSGVTGVPDFLINKRLLVIGAQSTEDLVKVFDRAMFGEESDLPVSPVIH